MKFERNQINDHKRFFKSKTKFVYFFQIFKLGYFIIEVFFFVKHRPSKKRVYKTGKRIAVVLSSCKMEISTRQIVKKNLIGSAKKHLICMIYSLAWKLVIMRGDCKFK